MSKRGDPTKHVGFRKAAESAAAGEGEDLKHGEAIIAASAQKASKAAKAKNPRLKKVSGA
jgi:hypothetical protein